MRTMFLFFMLLTASLGAAPLTVWDKSKVGEPKSYARDGYTLTFTSAKGKEEGMSVAILTVTAPEAGPGVLRSEPGYDTTLAYFGTARIDPKNPDPVVLMSTYTGGAHCCGSIKLLERVGKGWKTVDLGRWDGDVLSDMPKDVDGDGVIDFVRNDNAFLYAFSSYAGSWPPPKILNVVGGKAVDVSREPRYRKLFLDEMAKAKQECGRHENGGCAGYVADAARAGRYQEAWTFMIAHYDPRSSEWPPRCKGKWANGTCDGTELKPKDFPQALSWFLTDTGYTQ